MSNKQNITLPKPIPPRARRIKESESYEGEDLKKRPSLLFIGFVIGCLLSALLFFITN